MAAYRSSLAGTCDHAITSCLEPRLVGRGRHSLAGSILTGQQRHRGAPTGLLRGKIHVRGPTRGKRTGVAFTKSCQRIVPISAKSKAAAVPAAGKQL
jgi:hypothetical protein